MSKSKKESKAPVKMGAPSKYNDAIPALLAEAMHNGLSVERFCRNIRISKDTFYNWLKIHQDLSDAFHMGKNDCEAFWEDWLVNNLDNKNANAGLVKMFFTNRFGWSDKKETSNTVIVKHEDALKDLK